MTPGGIRSAHRNSQPGDLDLSSVSAHIESLSLSYREHRWMRREAMAHPSDGKVLRASVWRMVSP
jgi:hypothetical protein